MVVVGAGPAGLAAACDLCDRGYAPLVIEAEDMVGGIARTLNHNGNRIDLGGHRFFTKSEPVHAWWEALLPPQGAPSCDDVELGRDVPLSSAPDAPDPELTDRVMLSRPRMSHIYYLRKFFDYPVSLSLGTLANLGVIRTIRIGFGYLLAKVWPRRPELTLEDFMVNRFGRPLYEMFFRGYTEKLWGVPCASISADWGAQRIKGISIGAAVAHAIRTLVDGGTKGGKVETSLIDRFSYPKLGPGQLWETAAEYVANHGGEVRLGTAVTGVRFEAGRVVGVDVQSAEGLGVTIECDALMSTLPIADLVAMSHGVDVPAEVRRVASGLPYRDFLTCGLLVPQLERTAVDGGPLMDNWIYIQEPEVTVGRVQIFNNWSPYMVADRSLTWIGTEYFCDEGGPLWTTPDDRIAELAASELETIGLIRAESVLDSVVIRVPKAYPAYFGTYADMDVVRTWIESVENLYVMGRNGMHRYNNMDHSVMSAWAAVRALVGEGTRAAVWQVNADDAYQE